MMNAKARRELPLCPSAKPGMEGSVVFGVADEVGGHPLVAYLAEPQPVTDEVLALAGPVAPTEVFRFAAPCAGHGCQHFDGSHCRLATRVVQLLPRAVDRLPPCPIRSGCRWWRQEGVAACLRCPEVISETCNPSELMYRVALPETPIASPSGEELPPDESGNR
jgi:hypothetical protein